RRTAAAGLPLAPPPGYFHIGAPCFRVRPIPAAGSGAMLEHRAKKGTGCSRIMLLCSVETIGVRAFK
ncbi:MAG: hypothetical protein KDJ29_15215, partial [Hyphomicrobiales bacterium]|nr:hypothetical protein [Hyphomicrobiales bacterium]